MTTDLEARLELTVAQKPVLLGDAVGCEHAQQYDGL